MKYCPACHSKNPNDVEKCTLCGKDIKNVLILPSDWEEQHAAFAAAFSDEFDECQST